MAGTTVASLNGVFKQAYAEGIEDLIPKTSVLQKEIDFKMGSEKLGDKFNQPVLVANEQGITFGGSTGTAFALNNPISLATQNALIPGTDFVLRSSLSYGAAAKASSNVNAFVDATSYQMENMVESMSKFMEVELLYGNSATGLGEGAVTGQTATTFYITFTAAQWAAGIWGGAEGVLVDVFAQSAPTVALNSAGPITVVKVDTADLIVYFSGISTDVTAIVAGTPVLVRYYGEYGNSINGLDYLMTTSGVVNNIDNTVYNLWAANTYAVGGPLTTDIVGKGLAQAQARGLAEDLTLLVSPRVWGNLNITAVTNNRRLDSSFKPGETATGSERITYYTQSGVVDIVSHIYVKEGDAFALPFKRAKRIGAQDISFQIPGSTEGEIFLQMPNNAGFEYRLYTNQGLFLSKPAVTTKFTGITAS